MADASSSGIENALGLANIRRNSASLSRELPNQRAAVKALRRRMPQPIILTGLRDRPHGNNRIDMGGPECPGCFHRWLWMVCP